MPQNNHLPVIVGIKDPKTLQSFQNTLRAVGVPKGVTQIIVGNPIEFEMARKAFGIQDSHPAFSVYNMGRVYVPDETLNNPNLIDQYLLHEFGHYAAGAYNQSGSQQNLSDSQRMAMEQAAEKGAQSFRDAYKLYRSPQGRAYQAEQTRIDSDAGKSQPTPAPVATKLVDPPHDHPVLRSAGGLKSDSAPVLLDKLHTHVSNLPQPDLKKAAQAFGIGPSDSVDSAAAKVHSTISKPTGV